ncbi:MAG: DUF503 family protein [Clostridiales bacterium]|nr:DUF503 family protein [Clostridiales bacterium]
MNIYILYLKLNIRLGWQCSIKERRKHAQSLRDHMKTQFNATVKIVYSEINDTFELYCVFLGESRSYLENIIEKIHLLMDHKGELIFSLESEIDLW